MATLPDLHERWIAALLGAPSPAEHRATCDTCAMCPQADGTLLPAAYPFRPDTKCCTYEPKLANFLAGGILAAPEEDPGRKSLAARVQAGRATPLGVEPNWRMRTKWDGAVHGISAAHRCPHYLVEEGSCAIWAHRPHACATYFCKHERGRLGYAYWSAVGRLLRMIEETLAAWCVVETGLPAPSQELLLIERERDPGDPPSTKAVAGETDPLAYAVMWGEWEGREAEFFRSCAERVAPLEWPDVQGLGGPELRMAAAVVQRGRDQLARDDLPERMALGNWSVLGASPAALTVQAHSPTDPVSIDHAVLSVLHLVDGRRTEEVLADIRESRGLELAPELLRTLLDYGVLREV